MSKYASNSSGGRNSRATKRRSDRGASLGRGPRIARCESLESRICLSAVLNIPGITNVLAANDDDSTGAVNLPVTMNFFGTAYSQVYVNNNGNVTFTGPLSDYTPDDLTQPGHIPEIAAFFADVDTTGTGSGLVTYGSTAAPFDFGAGEGVHNAFVVNYPNVGYYASNTDKLNNFQLILIDRSDTGAGNFDIEFNYNQIQWETGDASGGTDGLGGGTNAAAVGYTAGTGVTGTFFELPGSFSAGSLIDGGPDALISNMLNSAVPGQYIFRVRGGSVLASSTDATFAGGAAATLPFVTEQVIPTPSGQIFAVGHQGDTGNSTSQGVIELLNADGSVDTGFGTNGNGIVTTDVSTNDAFYGAAVDPAGNIVAVGGTNGSFLVARFNSAGSLDTTFGTGGFTSLSFGADGPANASSVAIEPDGSIVVGGEANNVFAVARLTASGAPDSSFNPGGADDSTFPAGGQRTVPTGSSGAVSQVLIENDGKILGVGADGANVAAFRLNLDGSNDDSFGSGGIATIGQLVSADPNGSAPVLEGIAVQPGGGILVAGEGPSGGLAAVRLTSAGQFDSSFNNGQTVVASFGGANDDIDGIVANPSDGEFVLLGTTNVGGTNQIAVAAFNPDGTVNSDFGSNGQLTLPALAAPIAASLTSAPRKPGTATPFAFHPLLIDFAYGVFQPDQKLLVGSSGSVSAAVSRLQPFMSPQSMIGEFGKIGRKNVKLPAFTLANGTNVTITLTGGGTGIASFVGNDVSLTLTGSTSVTIKTKGGAGTLGLSNVTSSGILHSFMAPTATLDGTLTAPGTISTLKLGGISGVVIAGTISNLSANVVSGSISCAGPLRTAKFGNVTGTIAAGEILNLSAGSLSGAKILAGANLGSDGQLGGTGGATDTFGSGLIATFKVTGEIADSFIGAGVNPVDGLFGDGDDTAAGSSVIRSITAKAVDSQSRFEAAVFPKTVHIPGKVLPASDSRFIVI